MRKNEKWTEKEKITIVKELISGSSYSEVCEKYNIKSTGMVANWKRKYLSGESLGGIQGKKPYGKEMEYEILKKSFALLKEIRGESLELNDIE